MTKEEIDTELRRIDAEKLFMNTKEKWEAKDFQRDRELFERMVELKKILREYQ